jgi:excisionase family DNA binding protein
MISDLTTHPMHYVTPRELADYWGVSVKTVYRWIDKGALPAEPIGPKLLRIKTDDARAFGTPPAEDRTAETKQ